ncbi:alpha/beta fold hydrolase [Sphingomonas swuensis]|uniref:Alpha/beta fold hydrolase n=1 Tax=Sphingomonas swuensis TaxID=977800 RepID=A0ABP7ST06_9SPHN
MTISTHHWIASDGVDLVWHETGEGRPVVLVHGLFSDAQMNWIKFGHAGQLAAAGFRVIMPDLRAHGASGKPHDPARYPAGILGRDLVELVAKLGLDDYDLGGFSLGSRTSVHGVAQGLIPRRLILAGMGLEGLLGWEKRHEFFLEAFDKFESASRGDRHWFAVQFMKSQKVDRVATRLLLESNSTVTEAMLEQIVMPTLVLCGDDDRDNGSATALAEKLPNATYAEVPGTHTTSVTKKALGAAMVAFLTEG